MHGGTSEWLTVIAAPADTAGPRQPASEKRPPKNIPTANLHAQPPTVPLSPPRSGFVQPCAAANPAGASRLQSVRPVRRVAALGSLGRFTRRGSCPSPTTRHCSQRTIVPAITGTRFWRASYAAAFTAVRRFLLRRLRSGLMSRTELALQRSVRAAALTPLSALVPVSYSHRSSCERCTTTGLLET